MNFYVAEQKMYYSTLFLSNSCSQGVDVLMLIDAVGYCCYLVTNFLEKKTLRFLEKKDST